MYANIVPAEPIVKAGKTNFQYVSGELAKGRRVVAIMVMHSPVSMSHLGFTTLDKDPVNVMKKAAMLIGILSFMIKYYCSKFEFPSLTVALLILLQSI